MMNQNKKMYNREISKKNLTSKKFLRIVNQDFRPKTKREERKNTKIIIVRYRLRLYSTCTRTLLYMGKYNMHSFALAE